MKFLLLCLLCFQLEASITSIDKIAQVDALIDEKTLVVFDVDDVLITTEDQFFHPKSDALVYPILEEIISQAKDEKEMEEILNRLSLCLTEPKREVVEKETLLFIQGLQEKGVRVIALTSCPTGAFGTIEKIERWRVEHLNSFGYDFSNAFAPKHLTLHKMQSKEHPSPLFEEGILFSKGYEKGDVLLHFLREINYKPQKVVFIDDLAHNVESVQEAIESQGIEFCGYHYTGANLQDKEPSEELLRKQLTHLADMGEWLSDNELS